jgi:glycosyltransferase involved in cell wall biosynthesis
MRIGIEGQRIFRRNKHGMDIVAVELIRNLQKIDTENEYTVFVRPDEDEQVISETGNFRIVKLDGGSYPLWEQVVLPRAAIKAACQVLHCTSNTAPVNTSIPLVVTLHDIIYMEKSYAKLMTGKGSAYQKLGNVYRRAVVPRVIARSRQIVTVSEFEKNRIGEFFHLQEDTRLSFVYNGVSDHFRRISDGEELSRIREKYNLPDRFFLFLGNTDPKKNTAGTIKAFAGLVSKAGHGVKLVITDYSRAELERILTGTGNPGLMQDIVAAGYVLNADLPAVYSLSEAFLYTSFRESFGIPILEAMSCETPVITSTTSSMPEVAGNAALFTNPFQPMEITEAMWKLMNEPSLKETLVAEGLKQASKFSWKAMAEHLLTVYQKAASA